MAEVVQNFLATPPRPLHQRRLRCFFLMSRPPLLLLRRGLPSCFTSEHFLDHLFPYSVKT